MATDVRSGTAQVTVGGAIPLGADGAAHIFVDPVNGDDENIGLSVDQAFQTINKAVERMNEWLALEIDETLVIELANGTYNEDVRVFMQNIPLQRVVFRGDDEAMTVLASGALTAATAYLATDAGAAFGTANQFAGQLVEVFDPAAPATTRQVKTIRSHTATAIVPIGPFNPIPVAGWTYRILTPAVLISGQADDPFAAGPALQIVLPWSSDVSDGQSDFPENGPILWLAFIRVTSPLFTQAIFQQGGIVKYMGIVMDGPSSGFRVIHGSASMYGIFTTVVDPVFGTSATFSSFVDSCLGARSTGGAIRADAGGIFGAFAAVGQSVFSFNSHFILFGGSVIGAFLQIDEISELSIVGGGVETADPLLPMLIRETPTLYGIQIREGSRAEIRDVTFQVLAGTTGAFHVNTKAQLDLRANITAAGGDVPGIGVHCENSGTAMIAAAVTFTTAGTNIRVGNGVSGNGDSTFAALTTTAPIYDHSIDNGRAAGGVQPGSLAAVWEV